MDLIHLLTVSRQQFAPAEVKTAARRLKDKYVGTGRRFLIEVSGGLTEQNISAHLCDGKPEAQSNNQTFLLHPREFAHQLELLGFFFITKLEVDIYSTSSVHQGTPIIDFSLKIIPKKSET